MVGYLSNLQHAVAQAIEAQAGAEAALSPEILADYLHLRLYSPLAKWDVLQERYPNNRELAALHLATEFVRGVRWLQFQASMDKARRAQP